jgi:hypothetical protein
MIPLKHYPLLFADDICIGPYVTEGKEACVLSKLHPPATSMNSWSDHCNIKIIRLRSSIYIVQVDGLRIIFTDRTENSLCQPREISRCVIWQD